MKLLDIFPVLPPSSFYAFLPPAVCICCISLSLAFSLLCTSTISPHHSSVYVCHLSLPPSCWVCSLLLPLPPVCATNPHLPLLLQCTWAFSQQLLTGIHTHLPLPAFPHALSSIFHPLLHAPLIPAHLHTIPLPSFWYSGSFCLLICTTLLSVSPLYHFSSVLTDLFSQIDSTGKMFLFAGVCKPALQTIQHCVKSEVVSLICRKILASCHHAHRVKSPKTLSFFSPQMTVLQGLFACNTKYSRYAFAYLQGSYWQKKRIYCDTNPCNLGHKNLNVL